MTDDNTMGFEIPGVKPGMEYSGSGIEEEPAEDAFRPADADEAPDDERPSVIEAGETDINELTDRVRNASIAELKSEVYPEVCRRLETESNPNFRQLLSSAEDAAKKRLGLEATPEPPRDAEPRRAPAHREEAPKRKPRMRRVAAAEDASEIASARTVMAQAPPTAHPVDLLALVRETLVDLEGAYSEQAPHRFARLTHEVPFFARGEHMELLHEMPDEIVEPFRILLRDLLLRLNAPNTDLQMREQLRTAVDILRDRADKRFRERMESEMETRVQEQEARSGERLAERERQIRNEREAAARRARRQQAVYDRPKEFRDFVNEFTRNPYGKATLIMTVILAAFLLGGYFFGRLPF
jgi:hypothetical protein